ncbi:MAG: aminotransferase class V-fold PLP-dependent enzyme [Oscillospiraceae bacterium]
MPICSAREDFPTLKAKVYGRDLIYLDSAATMQMPEQVMAAMETQQRKFHANVHRGIHYLSERSTGNMEAVRERVRGFLNAVSTEEIIFTSGTTQSLNIAAASFGKAYLGPGDAVIVSAMEHHSNFVPWQQVCLERGAEFRVVPVDERGELRLDRLAELLDSRVKLVSVAYVSNLLGTVNPVKQIIEMAHANGSAVLLDCAQAVRHTKLDVQELDCDFLCFSGHKLGGPTGTGVLYGKKEYLDRMPPAFYGGGMVDIVREETTSFTESPLRFEAGTPNITGIVGLGAAIDYLEDLGIGAISRYEDELLRRTEEQLASIPGVRIVGAPARRAGAISFNVEGFHCFDTAEMLDKLGVAVRSGHHCAQPLLRSLGLEGTVRVSPAFYNTMEEIDAFAAALRRVADVAGRIKK